MDVDFQWHLCLTNNSRRRYKETRRCPRSRSMMLPEEFSIFISSNFNTKGGIRMTSSIMMIFQIRVLLYLTAIPIYYEHSKSPNKLIHRKHTKPRSQSQPSYKTTSCFLKVVHKEATTLITTEACRVIGSPTTLSRWDSNNITLIIFPRVPAVRWQQEECRLRCSMLTQDAFLWHQCPQGNHLSRLCLWANIKNRSLGLSWRDSMNLVCLRLVPS